MFAANPGITGCGVEDRGTGMRFLITGGAGFLGSALARRLSALEHEVPVLDDLSAADPRRLPEEVTFTRGDVNDLPRLWTLLQGVDCVYHLAARVSVQESVRYPREYNAVNVGGTVSIMEAVRDVGIRRLVLVSSGAIYGNQPVQPVSEEATSDPQSPYAVSKLAAEQYVHTIGRLWGIETVSLRVFNAYGPGQQLPVTHPPVIPYFMAQTIRGGSVTVHGNGAQTRDFVYIDDVVEAMVAAATAPDVDRRVINVGSGIETNLIDLLHLIERVTGREAEVLMVPGQDGGVSRLCADISLARALLGYAPRVSLEDGLRRIVAEDERFGVMLAGR